MKSNPTTSSWDFEQLDGMTQWIETNGGPIYALMTTGIYSNIQAYSQLALSLDGETVEKWQGTVQDTIGYEQCLTISRCWDDIPLGRHKARGLWRTNAGMATSLGLERSLIVWGSDVALVKPVKILALGDSITWGYGDPSFSSYRGPLQTLLTTRGVPYDFVGSLQNGTLSMDRFHEGYGGWRTDQLASQISDRIATYQPHVILVEAGINDVVQNCANTENRIGSLIDAIATSDSTCLILVSTLDPLLGTPWDAERNRVNAALPPVVLARQSSGIHVNLVDTGNLNAATDLFDAGHPNVAGYAKKAVSWNAAMLANGH